MAGAGPGSVRNAALRLSAPRRRRPIKTRVAGAWPAQVGQAGRPRGASRQRQVPTFFAPPHPATVKLSGCHAGIQEVRPRGQTEALPVDEEGSAVISCQRRQDFTDVTWVAAPEPSRIVVEAKIAQVTRQL